MEEGKLKSKMGGEKEGMGKETKQRTGGESPEDADLEQMTDSGSSRKRIEGKKLRKKKKYKLPTPYLLFSIKLIFSNGSCRSRLGGTSIPITMLPTHTSQ